MKFKKEDPPVTCWKRIIELFLPCGYRCNWVIHPESPAARFTSRSITYKFMLCCNLGMKFSKFQGTKVHCLGSIVGNILILTFNRNENTTLVVVAPVLNVLFASAENTFIHLSNKKPQTNKLQNIIIRIHDDSTHDGYQRCCCAYQSLSSLWRSSPPKIP